MDGGAGADSAFVFVSFFRERCVWGGRKDNEEPRDVRAMKVEGQTAPGNAVGRRAPS